MIIGVFGPNSTLYPTPSVVFNGVYDTNGAELFSDLNQTVFTKVSEYVFLPKTVLSAQGGMAPMVVSPSAVMTFSLQQKVPYYALGTLSDYYNDKLVWSIPGGLQPNIPAVAKIIYCNATNDNSIFGGGLFLFNSDAGLYNSSDNTGATFYPVTSCPIIPIDIAYSAGILLAADSNDAVFTTDLVNWTFLNPIVQLPKNIVSLL